MFLLADFKIHGPIRSSRWWWLLLGRWNVTFVLVCSRLRSQNVQKDSDEINEDYLCWILQMFLRNHLHGRVQPHPRSSLVSATKNEKTWEHQSKTRHHTTGRNCLIAVYLLDPEKTLNFSFVQLSFRWPWHSPQENQKSWLTWYQPE